MLAGMDTPHKQAGTVRLTVLDLRAPSVPPHLLSQFLSDDERERAARFRFPHLRERFRNGRGMLRHVLSVTTGAPPAQLQFTYSDKGKPSLPDFPRLQFNVSHSGDLWACAVSDTTWLGLDIERIRPMPDCDAIARRFFAPSELLALNAFSEGERAAAFFRCWTRKEAYIKALGDGLSRDLASFTVSCADEEFSSVRDLVTFERWRLQSFAPAPGYAGALTTPDIATLLREP